MTIEHIRRGIEFDLVKTINKMKPDWDDNISSYAVALCVVEHLEKFVYIYAGESLDVVGPHIDVIAQTAIETAQERATGEKYSVHQEQVAKEVSGQVARFKQELSPHRHAPNF